VEALARRPLRNRVTGSVWGMPNDGIDGAVDLPDAVLHGVELAANHAREVRPSREDELSRAVSSQREEVEGCFRTGDPWERAIESIVRARQ
jgi:hypothetical protein